MEVKFNKDGLVPAIAQDAESGVVLMQAYMNREAYEKTLETGKAHYFSRSRGRLWLKGETSGHVQEVVSVTLDCDGDCVLLRVRQNGVACHTGAYSCFHNEVKTNEVVAGAEQLYADRNTIRDRIEHPEQGSYTNYLMDKGLDKVCKKVGEEASEVIIAAKNADKREISMEIADLLFHLQVLMEQTGVELSDVFGVVRERAERERVRHYDKNGEIR